MQYIYNALGHSAHNMNFYSIHPCHTVTYPIVLQDICIKMEIFY